MINIFVHTHTLIVSPNLNLNLTPQMFCRDGVHFSFYGNDFCTNFLANVVLKFSANLTPPSFLKWLLKHVALFVEAACEEEVYGASHAQRTCENYGFLSKRIARRLKQWQDGDLDGLYNEGKALQKRLTKGRRR